MKGASHRRAVLIGLLLLCPAVRSFAQRPAVFRGGVLNAASYAVPNAREYRLAPGSIASIFGSNLASSTVSADRLPLPKSLGGTTVTFDGIPAALFFVSPGQINVQVPAAFQSELLDTVTKTVQVIVSTGAGVSDAVAAGLILMGPGVFTLDGSGCGRAAILNVNSDGTASVNSPESSALPGGFISVFANGWGYTWVAKTPPDGEPTPSSPLYRNWESAYGLMMDRQLFPVGGPSSKAPGLVGVDQVNLVIPDDIEGCGVPLKLISGWGNTQRVPVSVRKGGGQCVDPPPDSLGVIRWERIIATGYVPTPPTDSLKVTFPSAIGKRWPLPRFKVPVGFYTTDLGRLTEAHLATTCRACPGFEQYDDTMLNAGPLTLQGPGFGPAPFEPKQVDGKLVYMIELPPGSIREGDFRVDSSGGPNVGLFQTGIHIPAPIELTTRFEPGTRLNIRQPISIAWTGGSPNGIVSMVVLGQFGPVRQDYVEYRELASKGRIDLLPDINNFNVLPLNLTDNAEIIVTVSSEDDPVQAFAAPGLTLGGHHEWIYQWRFGGLKIVQ